METRNRIFLRAGAAATMNDDKSARSSGKDRIEPVKHSLKKYLARAGLAVLASALARRKEHVLFRTL